MKLLALSLILACLSFLTSHAQTDTGNPRVWEAKVPGGEYIVALSKITSVSLHSYLLDASVVVTEVNVDTEGNSQVRFYHIEPVSPESLDAVTNVLQQVQAAADSVTGRVGLTEHNMVQKKYPVTTHAKIIEYRLQTRESLVQLYDSAKKSFTTGRGRRFEVK